MIYSHENIIEGFSIPIAIFVVGKSPDRKTGQGSPLFVKQTLKALMYFGPFGKAKNYFLGISNKI